MQGPTPGQIAFEAFHAASDLPRAGMHRYDALRESTRRLWEAAAMAAATAERPNVQRLGWTIYDAWIEATGLPIQHFMQFKDLCESARGQWNAAGACAWHRAGLHP